jgi:hypothetical protein
LLVVRLPAPDVIPSSTNYNHIRVLARREPIRAHRRARSRRVGLIRLHDNRLAADFAVTEFVSVHDGTVFTGNGRLFVSSGGM